MLLVGRVSKWSDAAKQMRVIRKTSTAVWLDRINAIYGGYRNGGRYSLNGHMRTASRQAKKAKMPVVLPLVIYDLPNRDCAALASNGELQGKEVNPFNRILKVPLIDSFRAGFGCGPVNAWLACQDTPLLTRSRRHLAVHEGLVWVDLARFYRYAAPRRPDLSQACLEPMSALGQAHIYVYIQRYTHMEQNSRAAYRSVGCFSTCLQIVMAT